MTILDGRKISKKILGDIKEKLKKEVRHPRLDIFLVGNDFASLKYVEIKKTKASEVGIEAIIHKFDESVSEDLLISQIEDLNLNPQVNGIMVQLPLPEGFDTDAIVNAIDLKKDVDGLSAQNLGRIFTRSKDFFLPATVRAIDSILKEYNIEVEGRDVVVVGTSREVGIPISALVLSKGGTVVMCHSKTKDLHEKTRKADILISATGVPHLIKEDMIKEGVVLIDVGFSMRDGKVLGDIDFENSSKKASSITPVPGGVGPVTVACLLLNTLESFRKDKDV